MMASARWTYRQIKQQQHISLLFVVQWDVVSRFVRPSVCQSGGELWNVLRAHWEESSRRTTNATNREQNLSRQPNWTRNIVPWTWSHARARAHTIHFILLFAPHHSGRKTQKRNKINQIEMASTTIAYILCVCGVVALAEYSSSQLTAAATANSKTLDHAGAIGLCCARTVCDHVSKHSDQNLIRLRTFLFLHPLDRRAECGARSPRNEIFVFIIIIA